MGNGRMRLYKSHKIVRAVKIETVENYEDAGRCILHPAAGEVVPQAFNVDVDFVKRCNPQAPGYYVIYENGYSSWSPVDPFEEGYVAINGGQNATAFTHEQIAEICHEANRAYCKACCDDDSQVPWSEAPDWQKQSAINGVKFVLDNISAPYSASHKNWMEEKVAQGWVYGEIKDPEARTHPCIVEWKDLPLRQQVKDILFKNTVLSLI